MSDFKKKLQMFQENGPPPPIKAKPQKSPSNSQSKIIPPQNIKEGKMSESTATKEEESLPLDLADVKAPVRCPRVARGSESSNEYTEDDSYELFDSVYDLPGLEHFLYDIPPSETPSNVAAPQIEDVPKFSFLHDLHKEDSIGKEPEELPADIQTRPEVIHMAPSPKLIEEIFNTSLWRDSSNFDDDFIFAPTDINAGVNLENRNRLSIDDPKKIHSSGRRSIFSSIFKSKKGSKKPLDKANMKDNSDTDSLKESANKNKSNNKATEEDSSFTYETRKKPLNSIFNRDWLNTIGDGVKKKASVMSELRKVFTHGKFKHFRKKPLKNDLEVSTENDQTSAADKYIEDDIYDDDDDEETSEKESNKIININPQISKEINESIIKKEYLIKNKNNMEVKESDIESIYDDENEEQDIIDKEDDIKNKHTRDAVNIQEIYDSDVEEDKEKAKTQIIKYKEVEKRVSETESIYDNEEENFEDNQLEYSEKETNKIKKVSALSNGKSNIEDKKKNIFASIFSKTVQKQDFKGKKISSKTNKIAKKNQKDSKKNQLKSIEKQEAIKIKSDILVKISDQELEMYDQDEEIIEEYISDEDVDEEKDVEDRENNKSIVKTSNKAKIKNDVKKLKNEMIITENQNTYDEDVDIEDNKEKNKSTVEIIKEKTFTQNKTERQKITENLNDWFSQRSSKQIDTYDEDECVLEEYASDAEISTAEVKQNNEKKSHVKETDISKQPIKPSDIKKIKNNIFSKITFQRPDVYDEDDEVIEEYVSDSDIDSAPVSEKNEKKIVLNKEFKNNAKKPLNNSVLKKKEGNISLPEPSEIYDDENDEDEIEEKIHNDEDNTNKLNKKGTIFTKNPIKEKEEKTILKINLYEKESSKKFKPDKKITKHPEKIETIISSRGQVCQSEIYDEDNEIMEEDSIYDDEEAEEELEITQDNKLKSNDEVKDLGVKNNKNKNKIFPKNFLKQKVNTPIEKKRNKKEIQEEKEDPTVIKEHGMEHSDAEIYDEDESFFDDEIKLSKENNNMKNEDKRSDVTEIPKSNISFMTMLNEGIKRRQHNIIANVKNITLIPNTTKKKKKKKLKVPQKDTEESSNSSKDVGEQSLVNKDLQTEEDLIKCLKKKNLEIAKKTFKLKEPIQSIATAKALKTIIVDSKTYLQFNRGELLDVLEYRNELVLVQNAVGKCGLTSSNNIEELTDIPP